jgi:hypothetical protein
MSSNVLNPEIAAILAKLPARPKGRLLIEQQRAGFAMMMAGMHAGLAPHLPNGKSCVRLPYR